MIATDINQYAWAATARTAAANEVRCADGTVDIVGCDLLRPLRQRLRGAIDVLLFNPPYVPTETAE